MKELLADTDRRLHFRIEPCGLQLTFPAYVYNFVEDVEARVLHHKIEEAGIRTGNVSQEKAWIYWRMTVCFRRW